MRLLGLLQNLRQFVPMTNKKLLGCCAVVVAVLCMPVKGNLFSALFNPKQQYYEDLYRGRKEAVSKAYFLIERGRYQIRENMLAEAEESFKKALKICQTQGLRECERDAMDGWGDVLEALGEHQRERVLRQLRHSYLFTTRNW